MTTFVSNLSPLPVGKNASDSFRADIEGLRAVAVLLVVAYHAGFPGLRGGFIGVDVFFVISGFLITGILARSMQEGRYSIVGVDPRALCRIGPGNETRQDGRRDQTGDHRRVHRRLPWELPLSVQYGPGGEKVRRTERV